MCFSWRKEFMNTQSSELKTCKTLTGLAPCTTIPLPVLLLSSVRRSLLLSMKRPRKKRPKNATDYRIFGSFRCLSCRSPGCRSISLRHCPPFPAPLYGVWAGAGHRPAETNSRAGRTWNDQQEYTPYIPKE